MNLKGRKWADEGKKSEINPYINSRWSKNIIKNVVKYILSVTAKQAETFQSFILKGLGLYQHIFVIQSIYSIKVFKIKL